MAKTNTNLYNELKERGLLYQCTDEEALKKAKDIVKVSEPVANWCIFKTNQHTDMHITCIIGFLLM